MFSKLKVKCACNYKCRRQQRGFDMVSQRTHRRHCTFDVEGAFCVAKYIVDRSPSINALRHHDRRHIIEETGAEISRQTQWRDKRSGLDMALMGA
ncbi:unnamed protein product [Calypogeia fissa]